MALTPGVAPCNPDRDLYLVGVMTACVTNQEELDGFVSSVGSVMGQQRMKLGEDSPERPPLESLWISVYISPHLPDGIDFLEGLGRDRETRDLLAHNGDIRVLRQARQKPSEVQISDILERMPGHYARRPGFLECAWILRGTQYGIWNPMRAVTYLNVLGMTVGEGQFSDTPVACIKMNELLMDRYDTSPLQGMVSADMVQRKLGDMLHLRPTHEMCHLWWPQAHDLCVPYKITAEYYCSGDAERRYLAEYNTFSEIAFVDWVCNYADGTYSVLQIFPHPEMSDWAFYWVPLDWRRRRRVAARVIDAMLRPDMSPGAPGVVVINHEHDALEHAMLIGEMMEIPLWERNKSVYELRKHQMDVIDPKDSELRDRYTALCGQVIATRILEKRKFIEAYNRNDAQKEKGSTVT